MKKGKINRGALEKATQIEQEAIVLMQRAYASLEDGEPGRAAFWLRQATAECVCAAKWVDKATRS